MRESQTEVHFGNNEMEKIYEKSETHNALPTKIDVPKIINRIMSKKHFADASVIFIVTCDDEEDRASSNVDLSTDLSNNIKSSEFYVPVKSIRQVDPDSALKDSSCTKCNEQICGTVKKFYLQEIASNDTETMFQNESLEVLRRIKRSSGHPNEIAQMRVNAVQGVGSKTTAGVRFYRIPVMRMASVSLPCPCGSVETSHHRCNRGRNPQQKSPTLSPPGIFKVKRIRSVKVQKPSIESIRHEDETAVKADEFKVTNRSVKVQKPSIDSIRHEGGTAPEKLADELKVTSNRSVKVQKPSIESIRHEGGIAPEKLAGEKDDSPVRESLLDPGHQHDSLRHSMHDPEPDSTSTHRNRNLCEQCKRTCTPYGPKTEISWLRKSPAKDPNEPKDLVSPNRTKLKQATIEKLQKWEPKGQPMPGLQTQNQQLVKLTEEVMPVPQKLASAKTAKKKEEETVCMCKKNKSMSPKEPVKLEKVTPVPQKLAGTKTAKQKEEEIVCMCKNDKLMSPEEPEKLAGVRPLPQKLASAKIAKQKEAETLCMCKKNKSMSPKEPVKLEKVTPVPQKLAGTKTAKQKDEETVCMCKNDKLLNPEEPKKLAEVTPLPQKLASAKTAKQKDEETVCMCKNDKLLSLEEPKKLAEVKPVPQTLESTKTAKQKEKETVCMCKNDNLVSSKEPEELAEVTPVMSPKQLASPKNPEGQKSTNRASKLFTKIKNSIKINESPKNQIGQQAPSKLKDKDLQSPKTRKQKERKVTCKCIKNGKQKEGKVTCKCEEKGKQKEGKVTCKCEEKGKQNEGDIKCECKEDKPMSPKAPTTPITRHPPLLPPVLLGPVETTPEGKFYEVIGPSCKWVDNSEIKRLRSQLTRSTSGFTVSKRKKIVQSQSEDSIELDFGDAIRYFASINPERFQQLMREELEDQLYEQKKYEGKKGKEGKKLKKKMEKEKKKLEKAQREAEKKGKINITTTTDSSETFESSEESEDQYPKGFKLSIGVKDSKRNAFAGWDCTDIFNI